MLVRGHEPLVPGRLDDVLTDEAEDGQGGEEGDQGSEVVHPDGHSLLPNLVVELEGGLVLEGADEQADCQEGAARDLPGAPPGEVLSEVPLKTGLILEHSILPCEVLPELRRRRLPCHSNFV